MKFSVACRYAHVSYYILRKRATRETNYNMTCMWLPSDKQNSDKEFRLASTFLYNDISYGRYSFYGFLCRNDSADDETDTRQM
jgi:hypothetical protein